MCYNYTFASQNAKCDVVNTCVYPMSWSITIWNCDIKAGVFMAFSMRSLLFSLIYAYALCLQ